MTWPKQENLFRTNISVRSTPSASGKYGPSSDTAAITGSGYLDTGYFSLSMWADGGHDLFDAYGSGQANASANISLQVVPLGTRLVGLEVIQTVQDWNNSVPLIEGKPTYVRAHLEPISAPSVPIKSPVLRGFDGQTGQELPLSPLKPLNDSAKVALPRAADPERRANWNESVNFHLPQSWTTNRLGSNVRLELEMVGLQGDVRPLIQPISFQTSPRLELRMVKVSVVADGTNVISSPPESSALQQEISHLAELFPLTREAIQVTETSLVIDLYSRLSAVGLVEQIKLKGWVEGQSAISVAAASGRLEGDLAGTSDNIPGSVVAVRIDEAGTLAHEIAHALGEFHTVNARRFGTVVPRSPDPVFLPETNYAAGPSCGGFVMAAPLNRAVDFPFFDDDGRPRIGPVNEGTNRLVYGLENGSRPDAIRVINPFDAIDLMGCGRSWISTHTYGRLRAALAARWPRPPFPPPRLAATGSARAYLVIRGLVDFGSNTVTLLPFISLSLDSPPAAPTGNTHLLKVYRRSGIGTNLTLLSIPFTPITPKVEPDIVNLTKGFFDIPIAGEVANLVRMEVSRNATVLANRSRSATAPAIQLSSPAGGEFLGNGTLMARWNASDAEGNPLTYQVQFSPDGGLNWQTLAFDWPTNEFPLFGNTLPASTNALFKVVACDGINTSDSQSARPFTVLNHAPVVEIISPSPGHSFGGDVPIVLEALVSDLDDGGLPGYRVTWTSSLDGLLGNGSRVETKTSSLSEGSHLITVTAVDSAGATNSASVSITVSRLVAAQFQTIAASTNGILHLSIWGDVAGQHTLETSTNLVEWISLSTNATPSSLIDLVHTNNPARPYEFFRVRTRP